MSLCHCYWTKAHVAKFYGRICLESIKIFQEIWLSPVTKVPTPTENPKCNVTKQKRHHNFDNTTIADRLRTSKWSNDSHPTGVVEPGNGSFYWLNNTIHIGISFFFLHFWTISFQLFNLLCLAMDNWWGLCTRNAHMIHIVIQDKKEEIWPSPMTKAPTPTEMSKGQSDNTNNATKKFD